MQLLLRAHFSLSAILFGTVPPRPSPPSHFHPLLRTAASSCRRSRIGRRGRRGTVRLEAPAGLAVSPPAIILLGFLRRRPACSLEQGTLKFQAAAARMHAMDSRAAGRVSFLGELWLLSLWLPMMDY